MQKRSDIAFARALRSRSTEAEIAMWRALRGRQLRGRKFRRQVPIGQYVVDFLCIEDRLIIELDGGQHAAQSTHDAIRTTFLQSVGFRVLRFWNHDVLRDREAVLEHVLRTLRQEPHPHPSLRADLSRQRER